MAWLQEMIILIKNTTEIVQYNITPAAISVLVTFFSHALATNHPSPGIERICTPRSAALLHHIHTNHTDATARRKNLE
jgi:hypothetical protein